ncbi:MAG: fluoride efflux transporter CrcB [Cyanobacteria bacterium J06626_14]
MSWVPLVVSIGAILGAISRYYTTQFWAKRFRTQIPFGTFVVNLLGSFLIGLLSTFFEIYSAHPSAQLLIFSGFLGSYTTFSSYILEASQLLKERKVVRSLFYGLGSPMLGFVSLGLGVWFGLGLIGQ